MTLTSGPRPTFVGVGGMKCASTWLSECLRAHPEIFVSSPKEVHFFDWKENLARGVDWYWHHFQRAANAKAIGEIGATYFAEAKSVQQMRSVLGPVKVIVVLRDPVKRFLSEYKHHVRSGALPIGEFGRLDLQTLAAAVEKRPGIRTGSLYADRLQEFQAAFSNERVFVALKDDIDTQPNQMLTRLYRFLGVDPTFAPPMASMPVSPGIVPRFMMLEQARQGIYGAVRERAPWVIDWVRRSRLAEAYRHLNAAPAHRNLIVEPEARNQLRRWFANDIHATEAILGRSLAAWKAASVQAA